MTEFCDCIDTCKRAGFFDDGSGGWFCPYEPGSDIVCKKLTDNTIKAKMVIKADLPKELKNKSNTNDDNSQSLWLQPLTPPTGKIFKLKVYNE